MRRRRSRLPLIVLGGIALLLGGTLGMAASNLGWLRGGAATASPTSTQPVTADASATAGANGPGESASAGATAAAGQSGAPASGSVAPSGAPGSSPQPSDPAASSGVGPSPGKPSAPSKSAPAGSSAGPSPATNTGGQARPVFNGSRAKKVVALTFDDGYNPVALRQLLAILQREHVTATFFPYGWAVHADPAGWHMVVAAGYPVGNHTLTHSDLTTETPDQVYNEMVHGRATIDLYSGGKSVNLMRPPDGAYNVVVAKAIAKAGYNTMVLWDVDTFDWQGPSAATILARAVKGTNGSIVLMHAGPLNTPKALPAIIANYRARGFTFVTVPELLAAR